MYQRIYIKTAFIMRMIEYIFLVIVLLTVEDQSFLIIRRWKTMKHGNGACTNVSIEKKSPWGSFCSNCNSSIQWNIWVKWHWSCVLRPMIHWRQANLLGTATFQRMSITEKKQTHTISRWLNHRNIKECNCQKF